MFSANDVDLGPLGRVGEPQPRPARAHRVNLCCATGVRSMVSEMARCLDGLGFETTVSYGAAARRSLMGEGPTEPTIHVVCVQGSLHDRRVDPLRGALADRDQPNQHLFVAVLDLSLPLALVGQIRRFAEALEGPGHDATRSRRGVERRQWREHAVARNGMETPPRSDRPLQVIDRSTATPRRGPLFSATATMARVRATGKYKAIAADDVAEEAGGAPAAMSAAPATPTDRTRLESPRAVGDRGDAARRIKAKRRPSVSMAKVALRRLPTGAHPVIVERPTRKSALGDRGIGSPDPRAQAEPKAPATASAIATEPPRGNGRAPVLWIGVAVGTLLWWGLWTAPPAMPPGPSARAAGVSPAMHDAEVADASQTSTIPARHHQPSPPATHLAPDAAPSTPTSDPTDDPNDVPVHDPTQARTRRLTAAVAQRRAQKVGSFFVATPPNAATTSWANAADQCRRLTVNGVGGWALPWRKQLRQYVAARGVGRGLWWSRSTVAGDPDMIIGMDAGTRTLNEYMKSEVTGEFVCVRAAP